MKKANETENEKEAQEKLLEANKAYESRWIAVIPKIKKVYPAFSDEDLKHIEGSEHKRWALMLKKSGLNKKQLIKFINTLE